MSIVVSEPIRDLLTPFSEVLHRDHVRVQAHQPRRGEVEMSFSSTFTTENTLVVTEIATRILPDVVVGAGTRTARMERIYTFTVTSISPPVIHCSEVCLQDGREFRRCGNARIIDGRRFEIEADIPSV